MQVSGTVTLPEVPPPAEVAVEAGVAAARGGQQPPDQQKGQLQVQAAADVPEGQGQQQLQAQVVSDTPEQPALQQQQQQQQSPPQGAAGALQRQWERLKCGPLGQGKSERANTLKPLQRQASAEALTTPQRQASAETLQPLQRQASADTLKPLPSSSDRGQWQATSNLQAPLQRQRSAGHTRKVSMDGSGRPPKSPTVGSLQSPQRCAAQYEAQHSVSSLRSPQRGVRPRFAALGRACPCAILSFVSAVVSRFKVVVPCILPYTLDPQPPITPTPAINRAAATHQLLLPGQTLLAAVQGAGPSWSTGAGPEKDSLCT